MTANSYALAERIQREVNFSTTYRTDAEQYGRPEHWVEAGRFGDCEDYALLNSNITWIATGTRHGTIT